MQPTYSFTQIIWFIHHCNSSEEVKNIAAVFYDEHELYAPFYSILIDTALNIAFQKLQIYEQTIDSEHKS